LYADPAGVALEASLFEKTYGSRGFLAILFGYVQKETLNIPPIGDFHDHTGKKDGGNERSLLDHEGSSRGRRVSSDAVERRKSNQTRGTACVQPLHLEGKRGG